MTAFDDIFEHITADIQHKVQQEIEMVYTQFPALRKNRNLRRQFLTGIRKVSKLATQALYDGLNAKQLLIENMVFYQKSLSAKNTKIVIKNQFVNHD
ncbi:hypothetical protein Ddc_23728 [Ditylenchus destructor]|nr:hypothetical protein Ddc_23728 [Ditylenchus destructor]